jgi:hypothetical protein
MSGRLMQNFFQLWVLRLFSRLVAVLGLIGCGEGFQGKLVISLHPESPEGKVGPFWLQQFSHGGSDAPFAGNAARKDGHVALAKPSLLAILGRNGYLAGNNVTVSSSPEC